MSSRMLQLAAFLFVLFLLAACSSKPSPPKGMKYIPGGKLQVGAGGEVLSPPVEVKPFFIDQYEVTNERFDRCLRQGQCKSRERPLPKPFMRPKQPAVMVDFHQAWALCRFEGKRLASQTQWTYSTQDRIVNPTAAGGNRIDAVAIPGHRFTFPVGTVSDDKTDHDVYDLGGNVAEIVAEPTDSSQAKSKLAKMSSTIIMGSSYLSPPGESINNPRQVVPNRHYKTLWVGFRCAKGLR